MSCSTRLYEDVFQWLVICMDSELHTMNILMKLPDKVEDYGHELWLISAPAVQMKLDLSLFARR